jgi:hypothetical protein
MCAGPWVCGVRKRVADCQLDTSQMAVLRHSLQSHTHAMHANTAAGLTPGGAGRSRRPGGRPRRGHTRRNPPAGGGEPAAATGWRADLMARPRQKQRRRVSSRIWWRSEWPVVRRNRLAERWADLASLDRPGSPRRPLRGSRRVQLRPQRPPGRPVRLRGVATPLRRRPHQPPCARWAGARAMPTQKSSVA